MKHSIVTDNLSKRYGKQWAVQGLNLQVAAGEIYGFLGRNGAGKTTTIRLMLGLAAPTTGHVQILGKSLKGNSRFILRRTGSLIEHPGFYLNLSAEENLDLYRRLNGIRDKNRISLILKQTGLEDTGPKLVKQFSLGMKQRLGIARALLHNPEILILDEPTNGLDPVGIKEVRFLIKELARKQGMTVFVSSHILSEVQQIADTIGIIDKGMLVKEVSIAQLREMNRRYLEIRVSDDNRAIVVLEKELGIMDYEVYPDNILRIYAPLDKNALINRRLNEAGIEVSHLAFSQDNLEDFFFKYTGGKHA